MSNRFRLFTVIILGILLTGMISFLALGMYYRRNFAVNTWINQVYCTGKSIEEVNEELIQNTQLGTLNIKDKEGNTFSISYHVIELTVDYRDALKRYLNKNNAYEWYRHIKSNVESMDILPDYSWNKELLEEEIINVPFIKQELNKASGCAIDFDSENGVRFYDGNTGRLDLELVMRKIQENLGKGIFETDLYEEGCYIDIEDQQTDKECRRMWNQLRIYFENHHIIYDMGAEQLEVNDVILSKFLVPDEEKYILTDQRNEFVIDTKAVEKWVDELCLQYDTANTQCEFKATRGDVVSVPYVTYGTKLNEKAEKEFLIQSLTLPEIPDEDRVHIPEYTKQGFTRGLNDIGDTYIEVDMGKQHIYYYRDGELLVEADIVTGNMRRKMSTPEGVNYVYYKQKNRVLIGPDYRTPVKYWMAVKGAIGIHDASWRKEFGGEIYLTNGSHGCINTPLDQVTELYELVELGTPVVMFY